LLTFFYQEKKSKSGLGEAPIQRLIIYQKYYHKKDKAMQDIQEVQEWVATVPATEFETNGSNAVLVNGKQIAIYYFADTQEWYATDNECPHQKQQALSRGIIGSEGDEPKVACPFHKKSFSLKTGQCLSGEDYKVNTYPVKVEDGMVYLGI